MESLRKLFKSALDIAEKKGDERQQIDMGGVVAVTSQAAGVLDDLMTGKRKREKNKHHPIPDLTNAVITGIQTITTMRSEIKDNKK